MARVAFFTERLPPHTDPIAGFSYDLIRSLAEQQHEALVLSTFRPDDRLPLSHPRIEILRPFRRWSWLELPKVLPLLLQFHPDILHAVQPRAESLSGLTNAFHALPSLLPLLKKPLLVSSYYDFTAKQLRSHRFLLEASDAITVSNTLQAERLKSQLQGLKHTPTVHVLPVPGPIPDIPSATESAESVPEVSESGGSLGSSNFSLGLSALHRFFEEHEKIVMLPGDLSSHQDIDRLFEALIRVATGMEMTGILFAGSWGHVRLAKRKALWARVEDRGLGAKFLMTGSLSASIRGLCLRKASCLFVASLPTASLELTRMSREALRANTVLLMNSSQAAIDPLPWQDGQQAFICPADSHAWFDALQRALSDEGATTAIRQNLPEFSRLEVLDQPGNVMSRLYTGLLTRSQSKAR